MHMIENRVTNAILPFLLANHCLQMSVALLQLRKAFQGSGSSLQLPLGRWNLSHTQRSIALIGLGGDECHSDMTGCMPVTPGTNVAGSQRSHPHVPLAILYTNNSWCKTHPLFLKENVAFKLQWKGCDIIHPFIPQIFINHWLHAKLCTRC